MQTLAELWIQFEQDKLKTYSYAQKMLLKKAFYHGAFSYVSVLADFDPDELFTVQGQEIFDQLFDELTIFFNTKGTKKCTE